jgi:hypothetical protein
MSNWEIFIKVLIILVLFTNAALLIVSTVTYGKLLSDNETLETITSSGGTRALQVINAILAAMCFALGLWGAFRWFVQPKYEFSSIDPRLMMMNPILNDESMMDMDLDSCKQQLKTMNSNFNSFKDTVKNRSPLRFSMYKRNNV